MTFTNHISEVDIVLVKIWYSFVEKNVFNLNEWLLKGLLILNNFYLFSLKKDL